MGTCATACVSPAPRCAPGGEIAMPLAASAPARISARAFPRELERPSPYLLILAAAIVLAGISLLLPSSPAYDPWAWIVWGRQISHLGLITIGGPTWKPLPVIFTTAFSPFGAAASDLWLVGARAGGIMAAAAGGPPPLAAQRHADRAPGSVD